jgi:ATP-dependent DNA helicase HFM1/MER3
MKLIGSNIRFVALSATIPNSSDICDWLGRNPLTPTLPADQQIFGPQFRPVQLERHVYGFQGPPNDFAFDKVLDKS